MKNSFVFYADWWEVISELPDKERLECLDAICCYTFDGKVPLDPSVKAITGLMRSAIDRDASKWEKTKEVRRKAARARWDKAEKDNSIKESPCNTNNANASFAMQDDANNAVNVNVNVNDNVNDNINIFRSTDVSSMSVCVHEDSSYSKYLAWRKESCPHLSKMQEMTEKEFKTVIELYGREKVIDTLVSMENYKDTARKNRSIYRTLRNWLNRSKTMEERKGVTNE